MAPKVEPGQSGIDDFLVRAGRAVAYGTFVVALSTTLPQGTGVHPVGEAYAKDESTRLGAKVLDWRITGQDARGREEELRDGGTYARGFDVSLPVASDVGEEVSYLNLVSELGDPSRRMEGTLFLDDEGAHLRFVVPEGTYASIYVHVENRGGASIVDQTYEDVVVDATPPTLEARLGGAPVEEGLAYAEGAALELRYRDALPLSGEDGEPIALVCVQNVDTGAEVEVGTWSEREVDGEEVWVTTTPVLEDGAYEVRMEATDLVGNASEPYARAFVVDADEPAVRCVYDEAMVRHEEGDARYFDEPLVVEVAMSDRTLDRERSEILGLSLGAWMEGTASVPGVSCDGWEPTDENGVSGVRVSLTLHDGTYEMDHLAHAVDAFGRESSLEPHPDHGHGQAQTRRIVVDTKAPSIRADVSGEPAYVSSDGAVCVFAEPTQLTFRIADAGGLRSVELEGASDAAELDVDLGEGIAVVSCGESPFTRDARLVACDMAGNLRTWSLALEGECRTSRGIESAPNDPVTILGTGAPLASGGHPRVLLGDCTSPSVTVSGVDAGEHLNSYGKISIAVSERTLGLMAALEPSRTLYELERDGERVASGTVGYDGASQDDAQHVYEVGLVARQNHADDGAYVLTTSLADLAGNTSERDVRPFVVDTTPPVLDVSLDDAGVLAADGTTYHRRAFTAHLTLAERFCSARELNGENPCVKVEVSASDGSTTSDVVVSEWREESYATYACDVRFPEDGSFNLRVSGQDHAGNVLVGTDRTIVSPEGRFELGRHVADSTGPEVTVAYAPHAPGPHAFGGVDYFAKPVPVLVTVRDRNADPSRTHVSDSDGRLRTPEWKTSDADGRDTTTLVSTTWYREEDSGNGAGTKRPVVSAYDQAGNKTEVTMPEFVVDQTAPTIDRARLSRVPDVVMRDKTGAPIWLFRDLSNPVLLEIDCADEYPIDDVWAEDPDGAYDVHAEIVPGAEHLSLEISLKDFEREGNGRDTVFDRGVRVFCRDMAGNVREWSLGEVGAVVADRPADPKNVAPNGAAERPAALVRDVTPPVVSLSSTGDGQFNARPVVTEVAVHEHGLSRLQELDPGRATVAVRRREATHDGTESSSVLSVAQLEGLPDDGTLRIPFETDGHFEVVASLEDAAGNESDVVGTGEFTVDMTPPEVTVVWDNEDVRNGRYYRAPRTATVTVREHDFDPSLAKIETTGVVGPWSDDGDTHVCQVRFERDASIDNPHRLSIAVSDLAGNEAPTHVEPEFAIDTHAPSVCAVRRASTTDRYLADGPEEALTDESAFAQAFEPAVVFEDDASFDPSHVELRLEGSRTDVRDAWAPMETREVMGANGLRASWGNLGLVEGDAGPAYLMEADDVYTLTARVTDLAGNVSPDLRVRFSVNRYGSNFYVEPMAEEEGSSEGAGPLLAHAPRIVVHEVNVSGDPVGEGEAAGASRMVTKEYAHATTSIERTADAEGQGFLLSQSTERSERNAYDGWTETRYEILPGNFGEGSDSDLGDGGQGAYRVDVSSTDRAQNNNTTALFWESDGRRDGEPQAKGATVAFELDELGPKVEDLRLPDEWSLGGTFVSSFRLVDSITQGDRLEVLVDGARVPVWREGSSEALGDAGEVTRDGVFSFEIEPAPIWVPRTVEVRVSDYTGLADREDVCVEHGFRRSTLALELALVGVAVAIGVAARLVVRHRRLVP